MRYRNGWGGSDTFYDAWLIKMGKEREEFCLSDSNEDENEINNILYNAEENENVLLINDINQMNKESLSDNNEDENENNSSFHDAEKSQNLSSSNELNRINQDNDNNSESSDSSDVADPKPLKKSDELQ